MSEIELQKQLLDAGNKLLSPPSLTSELLESLNLVESLLLEVEQSPSESMREALAPSTKALIAEGLLRHSDTDVKVAVASCISEITRITAPEAPYIDDEMKEVFHLIVSSFEKLDDKSSRSYIKRISILETLARVRSCVVMLDLECDDLIVEMFRNFLRTIRDDHHGGVFTSMETIMTLVLEESEAISVDLLSSILNILKKDDKEVLPIARLLGEKVIANCASKVKPYLLSAVQSSGASLDNYSKAVADICQASDEVVEPTDDVANKNSDDENDLLNASSEKAVEVALESMEDAPPFEEVGPSTVGSPKTVMSNGALRKGSEDTPATNGNSMEVNNDTLDEKAEPSKTKVESVVDEETPKSKPQKSNSTKCSKSFALILSDRKSEVIDTPEHEENYAKDVEDIKQEDPATDTTVAAQNEKSLEESILSPVVSDNAHVDLSLPSTTGSLADEALSDKTRLEKKKEHPIQEYESASDVDCKSLADEALSDKTRLEKKKEHLIQENESASNVDCKKESDTQQDSEGATGLDSTMNKHAASDQEEKVADSSNDTKKEGDGDSAKEVIQEAEVGGSQCGSKNKRGQAKTTPAKEHSKTPANDDKKKTVVIPRPTPKATKDVSGMGEAAKSSSKRKRPSEEKADENDLLNTPSEKAVEVALESMEDAPPEEVGPSTVGSPKTIMSNSSLKKGSEDTPATNDNSVEVDNDTLDEKAEPSKTEVESVADEKTSKSKPQKSNRRKGRKSNSTKSSKSFAPILSDRKSEVIDTPEHEENDAKDVDDINQEDPATDTTVVAHNEKSLEDNAHVDPSLPSTTGGLADETLSDKTGLEKKKEHPIQENESASDVVCKKESDTQPDSEGATGLDSMLNKHAASDQEERVADSANDLKNEGDNINELDGNSAKEVVHEAEAGGSQRVNKKKRGQTKATPAKGHSKTPAKDDKKKTVVIPEPTPKATKDVSGMDEAAKSSSKRKRPSEEKAHQTKDYGPELVGLKVEVWWPDDRKFYKGAVKSFDAAEIKHKIFYDDGDIELLDLKQERWKFADKNEVHASDGESPDESDDETPIGKKSKTSASLGAKQGKTSSTKTSGALSSKSKSAPKSGKTQESSKKVGKSVSKASKSGNTFSDDTSKSAKKSKDDEESLKGNVKSKQGTSAKSKGKSPKSVGKSNSSTSKKVKVSTSSADEDTEDESPEPNKPKGKFQSTQKSQKNSNKRKR